MRALLVCGLLAACTPDVVSGAYDCGPEQLCPDGQACNGTEDMAAGLKADTCVLEANAQPFACTPRVNLEPDDTMAEAHFVPNLNCVGAPFTNNGCMLASDDADWMSFVAPSTCSTVGVEVRVEFPIAYERLGLELWDVDHNMQIATDTACKTAGADQGSDQRCLDVTLVPGTKYAVKVTPTGEGTCDGDCAYNRYILNVQLTSAG